MTNYNFSTLNDKEFEQIVRDLLNAKFGLLLQSFKAGRDKGIDLRYSTPEHNHALVVQVKHYVGSSFAQLKHVLRIKEYPKVELLNPERYMVVTSLPLNADDKDELKLILSPYVLSSSDIIGQEDLNSYLSEFKELEKRYFKLWFSSIEVFNAVLNNAVEGRTRYMMEEIQKKMPYYVITKKLDAANKILLKEKLLLITGQPGIGKTTLAEIILFERAKLGAKIYKVENISEAEGVISPDEKEVQLFYFDDFLGANYYEIINAHKTESQITSFVERVINTPGKYLILTTRTVILNYAVERYEKIGHSRLCNRKFEIKLNDYNKYEKAVILYNHLYFKQVEEKYFGAIIAEKFYFKIIEHKNYTPRIIEFISDPTRIGTFDREQFLQFVMNNLANPKEIWKYSFNNQIEYMDRCLLLTLFTFDNGMSEDALNAAFECRLQFEKQQHNQVIQSGQFTDSVKILLNGFISAVIHDFGSPLRAYGFINPSLADFLIGYVQESFTERKSIISSLKYVEQLRRFNPSTGVIPLDKELQLIVRDRIADFGLEILAGGDANRKTVILLETLCRYCRQVNVDSLLLANFKKISFEQGFSNIDSLLIYVMQNIGDAPETFSHIQTNFITIIEKLMWCIEDENLAKKIPELFIQYGYNLENYNETEGGFQNIIDLISSVLNKTESAYKHEREDGIVDLDAVEEIYSDLGSVEWELLNSLFPEMYVSYDFGLVPDHEFWKGKIEENIKKEDASMDLDEHYIRDPRTDDDHLIDELFASS